MSGRPFRRRRWSRLANSLAAVSGVSFVLASGMLAAQAAIVPPPGGAAHAATAAATSAVSQTQTITRTNMVNGQSVTVDSRTVKLNVDVTTNLINRQPIKVSWTGAHPSGGIRPNPNDSGTAPIDEYPMVLLECHGISGSTASSLSNDIKPQDCWTSTPAQRFFSSSGQVPPVWQLDQYASAADRGPSPNAPNPWPSACFHPTIGVEYWLPYTAPDGTSWPIGSAGCAGMPNEMSLTGGFGLLPSNETYGATGANGDGSATFNTWTDETALDLGCSQKVACALVAVPVMGMSCDPAGSGLAASDPAVADCEKTGQFPPGSQVAANFNGGDFTVSGWLWWAASNWRNRFVVPLSFAPPAGVCSTVNQGNLIQFYGSELLGQAMLQWQPHFCLDSTLFKVGYAGEPEPLSLTQITAGSAEAALVTWQPASGLGVPVVHAPVAATGFAISFAIDDSAGNQVTTLQLTPRLLAKLLTESYPGIADIQNADPELLHPCPGVPVPGSSQCTNPLNITLDPEFQDSRHREKDHAGPA